MKLSYMVTTHNEDVCLVKLLDILKNNIDSEDQIVVLDDYSDNEETKKILSDSRLKVVYHKLNKDFSEHKNVGVEACDGEYICAIDADEHPSETLLLNLKDIIQSNPTVELYHVPRINTIDGLTDQLIKMYGWRVNENKWINFPDFQSRIHKNDYPRIKWTRPLHEHIIGFKVETVLPAEQDFCLYHEKTAKRQVEQNTFYQQNWSHNDNVRSA